MGTLEYTDENFKKRLHIIKMAAENNTCTKIMNRLNKISKKYNNILAEVICIDSSNYIDEFHRLLRKYCVQDQLNDLFESIPNKDISITNEYNKIPKFEDSYLPIDTVQTYTDEEEMFCPCGGILEIDRETSELVCNICGEAILIVGTAYENIQLYFQDGQCSKHPSYERKKHGEKWLNRIQAKENIIIKKDVIKSIKRHLKTMSIKDSRKVTCELLRHCLKKTGNTKYNKHVSKIRYLITGFMPPRLTEDEYTETLLLFDNAVDAFDQIKESEVHNCSYHPYFIRRILEVILPENTYSEFCRKCQIISNIHIQSDNASRKRDATWKKICKIIPRLENEYQPTNKDKYKVPI